MAFTPSTTAGESPSCENGIPWTLAGWVPIGKGNVGLLPGRIRKDRLTGRGRSRNPTNTTRCTFRLLPGTTRWLGCAHELVLPDAHASRAVRAGFGSNSQFHAGRAGVRESQRHVVRNARRFLRRADNAGEIVWA